jgi:hypothetical protein
VIDQRAAGVITTEAMISALLNWKHSFGYVPVVDAVTSDAFMAGDWDDTDTAACCPTRSSNS